MLLDRRRRLYHIVTMKDAPPVDAATALAWIQEATLNGRYVVDGHFLMRSRQRRISLQDAKHAIFHATKCAEYHAQQPPLAGGTSWRVTGPDLDGQATSIGIEAFVDHLGRRTLLITVF